jgi:hypothetical protein
MTCFIVSGWMLGDVVVGGRAGDGYRVDLNDVVRSARCRGSARPDSLGQARNSPID